MTTEPRPPQVIVLAGPNGAGKSTAASALLPPDLPFLNADEIAKTLPSYPSRQADLEAGQRLIESLERLEEQRASFAVETTLAGRSLAARITRCRSAGYRFRLLFLWAPNADFCVQRVASRVRAGGHDIPETTIRRRYSAGLVNFFSLYKPIADWWAVFDATNPGPPLPVASGTMNGATRVDDESTWRTMGEVASDEP